MDVGNYRIESPFVDTPLGGLYEGVQQDSGVRVLIYRLRAAVVDDPRLVSRIQTQARLLRDARVPGVPKLLEAGRLPDRTVYLVTEAVPAGSLVSALARQQQTGESTDGLAIEVGQRLARTLARSHAEGVLHLALTPGQVLMAFDEAGPERVYLLGLGMASLLGRTSGVGWPEEHAMYAAPEQRKPGGTVSGATDVYALGVLLGQLLRDRADLKELIALMQAPDPSERPTMADVAAQLQSTQPMRAAAVAAAVARGLGTDPSPQRSDGDDREDSAATQRASVVAPPGVSPSKSSLPPSPSNPGEGGDGRIGLLFGNFRVVRKLGEGGMGIVYEAEHVKIGRRAAVKILHGRYAENEEYARRFLNEARAVNIVRHPGLVEIFEFGKLPDGTLFYIMEFLEGESLEKRIDSRRAPFEQQEAVNVAVQTARALAAAHEKGIVHRDLKPANIMFLRDPVNPGLDWVKVLDFGIAKVRIPRTGKITDPDRTSEDTGLGSKMGTPLYMAPEQHGGAEDADGRADVFSLGVVLYEMLAGQTPFRNNSLSLLIAKPAPIEKLNAKVGPKLATLIRAMMATAPEDRPTMRDVEKQLVALQAQGKRRRGQIAGVAAAAVLVIGGLVTYLTLTRVPSPAEIRAQALMVVSTSLRGNDAAAQALAAMALGQSRDLDTRHLLKPILAQSGADTAVLGEAARALGLLGDIDAQPALIALLERGGPAGLQVAVAGALAQLQHPRGTEALRRILGESDELAKIQAALLLLDRGDFSGAETLWARISRGAISDRTLTQVLGRLALSGDEKARARLKEEFARLTDGEARIYVAWTLTRLGDDRAREYLLSLSRGRTSTGEAAKGSDGAGDAALNRLLAERFLASLGEAVVLAPLLELACDAAQPDPRRELALTSLADGGRVASLPRLARILDERGASPRLRIAAAGAILAILAGEPARLAEQSLSWARSALGSDSIAARELAVAALADLADDQGIAPLGEALKDREQRIRRQAALALGRKTAHAALQALGTALQDSDRDVRTAGMESIGQVLGALHKRGDQVPDDEVRAQLSRLADSGSDLDRVVASGILVQLGAEERRATLRAGLSSKDPLVRQLAVKLTEGDLQAIAKALSDPERAVRFAAALRLARSGSKQGVPILREIAAGGDMDGVLAFSALRRLGELADPPPGLSSLLSTGDLPTRYAIMDVLRDVSRADVLPLLQLASIDPAGVVRRRAVEVAGVFYRQNKEPHFLYLIRSLRSDPDVIVRSLVASLLVQLGGDGATGNTAAAGSPGDAKGAAQVGTAGGDEGTPSVRDGGSVTPAGGTSPGSATAGVGGQIVLEGEEMVRVQVDRSPPQPLSDKPIAVTAGRHLVRYSGGQQEVTVAAGQTVRVRVPVRLADQLLHDGRDALLRKDLTKAQENLDRLRRSIQRGKASPTLQADLAFEQARLLEARGMWREALAEYNRCLSVPAAQRRPELNSSLQATLARLSSKAGRIQIYTLVGGQCQMTQELLLPAGEQIVSIGKGQTRTVFSQVGSTNKLTACQ